MTISFDLESIGVDPHDLDDDHRVRLVKDYGDPDAADVTALDRLALSPFTGRVIVVSLWDDKKDKGVCLTNDGFAAADLPPGFEILSHDNEAALLKTFWQIIASRFRFATFNGLDFDVPFLVARSLVHRVLIHRPLVETKPWEDVHVDLAVKLSMGWKGRPSLDAVCRALGVPSPKDGIDGAEVGAAWRNGRRDEVAAYCCRDTKALADCLAVYDASMFGRGVAA